MPESKFTPAQAEELADAFAQEGVDYLFIGKSGAILLGYPETTQSKLSIPSGTRRIIEGGRFPIASLEDIIASKRATGREKDLADINRLEQFRSEYARQRKRQSGSD